MKPDPLLAEYNRPRRSHLDTDYGKQHKRGKQYKGHNRAEYVHAPFHRCVHEAGQRDMPDMDYRESLKILHKRLCRYKIMVIGNKLCMDARFLTDSHNPFQIAILVNTQRNSYFVKGIERQNFIQVRCFPDDTDILIFFSPLFMVVKNSPDLISPFRIGIDTIDKTFRRPAVTNQKKMFLVVPFGTHGTERPAQNAPDRKFGNYIDYKEKHQHLAGKVTEIIILSARKQNQSNTQ